MSSTRAVFLDRDGVLNRRQPPSRYVTQPSDLELLPGVGPAVRQLNDAGYACIVVTNQRGIGRGLMTESDLAAVHGRLTSELCASGAVLDDILHCPHDFGDRCQCRKPAPGMISSAIARHGLDPSRSSLVGDSRTDIAAAHAAGVGGILVGDDQDFGGWPTDAPRPDVIVADLPAAVAWLLEREERLLKS